MAFGCLVTSGIFMRWDCLPTLARMETRAKSAQRTRQLRIAVEGPVRSVWHLCLGRCGPTTHCSLSTMSGSYTCPASSIISVGSADGSVSAINFSTRGRVYRSLDDWR